MKCSRTFVWSSNPHLRVQCNESWPSCHLTSHQQIKCNDGPNCHIVTISQTICLVSEGQEKPAHVQDNGNNENTGDRSHTHTAVIYSIKSSVQIYTHWPLECHLSRWSFKVLVLVVSLKICLGVVCRQSEGTKFVCCVCWPVSSVYLYSESIVLTGPNDAMNNNQRNQTILRQLHCSRGDSAIQYTTYRHCIWFLPVSIWGFSLMICTSMCNCT